MLEEKR